jgi:protein phosphatase
MAFRSAGKTDVGLVRKENQDNFLILPSRLAYAVADGMGGHAGGRQASTIAIDVLRRELTDLESLDELAAERILALANARILEEAKAKRLEGMGTTLVLAFYAGGFWRVLHIGDSRVYVVGPQGMYPLTKDHSLVGELLARGSITPEEARVHPHRNVLTRALGAGEPARPEWSRAAAAEADYLLLCTDGLYNMLEEDEMYALITAAGLTLEEKTALLIEEAKNRGGLDNITAILIAGEEGQ